MLCLKFPDLGALGLPIFHTFSKLAEEIKYMKVNDDSVSLFFTGFYTDLEEFSAALVYSGNLLFIRAQSKRDFKFNFDVSHMAWRTVIFL